jgi:dTDP-4-dehydrorhamnose reductase
VWALNRAEADLSDPEACAKQILNQRPIAVINAAAYTAVDNAETEEDLATLINALAPASMANACRDLSISFVHISTEYVFDGSGQAPHIPDATTNPVNAYGRSKQVGEDRITRSGAVYAILRTSWVVSAHGSNFVKSMVRASQDRSELSVVDDQIGGPTPAACIAKACFKIAHDLVIDPSKQGIYHLSGQPDVSWFEFAKTIFECTGREIELTAIQTSEYPTPAKRPANSRLDCASTKLTFDIDRPIWKNDLKEILQDLGEIQ